MPIDECLGDIPTPLPAGVKPKLPRVKPTSWPTTVIVIPAVTASLAMAQSVFWVVFAIADGGRLTEILFPVTPSLANHSLYNPRRCLRKYHICTLSPAINAINMAN